MSDWLHDLTFAWRRLWNRPQLTLVAVVALAIGIGANTAILSVARAVLVEALPYEDAERLALIWETAEGESREHRNVAYPSYLAWRQQSSSFSGMAAYASATVTLTGTDRARRLGAEYVTPEYFRVLGLPLTAGRTFLPEEDRVPGQTRLVVLGHGLWQRSYGADPGMVGRRIRLDDREYEVIGIGPPGFRGLTDGADLWLAMAQGAAHLSKIIPGLEGIDVRDLPVIRWHNVVARLAEGVSRERAQADLDTIAGRLAREVPHANAGRGAALVPLRDELFGHLRTSLLVLLVSSMFVLLIACTNVANLLLVEAVERRREIALRTALGARAGTLLRQLLIESVLLAAIGGGAGLFLALLGTPALLRASSIELPSFVTLGPDLPLLSLVLGIAVATGLLFGLAPAVHALKVQLAEALKEGSKGSASGAQSRLRGALVVSEVTLAVVLLIGAGLMTRSFLRLSRVETGFRTDNLLILSLDLPPERYSSAELSAFATGLLQRVRALPAVRSATLASDLPLEGEYNAIDVRLEGFVDGEAASGFRSYQHQVAPDFLSTLGIGLLEGREITGLDDADAPPVALVSRSMAERFWPGGSAVGKRLRTYGDWITVVGVVEEVKYRDLPVNPTDDPDLYLPLAQEPSHRLRLAAWTDSEPTAWLRAVREEVEALDPSVPLFDVTTMEARVSAATARSRFGSLLIGVFALMAVLLTAVGIYGVMAYSVRRRRNELGIRAALGADPGGVLLLVLRQGMTLVLTGLAAGLVAAALVARSLRQLLYGVAAFDPLTFLGVPALVALIGFLVTVLPARRASRVNPLRALRSE